MSGRAPVSNLKVMMFTHCWTANSWPGPCARGRSEARYKAQYNLTETHKRLTGSASKAEAPSVGPACSLLHSCAWLQAGYVGYASHAPACAACHQQQHTAVPQLAQHLQQDMLAVPQLMPVLRWSCNAGSIHCAGHCNQLHTLHMGAAACTLTCRRHHPAHSMQQHTLSKHVDGVCQQHGQTHTWHFIGGPQVMLLGPWTLAPEGVPQRAQHSHAAHVPNSCAQQGDGVTVMSSHIW
jgi:hypothetical protein